MTDHAENGKTFKTLNIIDEYTCESLETFVDHKFKSEDVLDRGLVTLKRRGVTCVLT